MIAGLVARVSPRRAEIWQNAHPNSQLSRDMRARVSIYTKLANQMLASLLGFSALSVATTSTVTATQVDIVGPPGSKYFGGSVAALPNGNFVVVDNAATIASLTGVGAVYLYSPEGVRISTLTGSSANDRVGDGLIVVLANGNFVVTSPDWNNGSATQAGAVTWINGNTGLSGVISQANSLVGTVSNDRVGTYGVTALNNGNYVAVSSYWNNGAGAVTWANGTTGLAGPISSSNSLVGTTAGDLVGYAGVTALSNGNYVVASPFWSDGATTVGAATWANGANGLSGSVSLGNSLVGTISGDYVGGSVTALTNGNYVVASPGWSTNLVPHVGAATWANGSTGLIGHVAANNSLIGTSENDDVSNGSSTAIDAGIVALTNGNYVVRSGFWNNGAATAAGAATWGNGLMGLVGIVSSSNSLIGTSTNDRVSYSGVTALTNGNYVVASSYWNSGATTGVGAATWANGASGSSGAVSPSNSLVGNTQYDQVGYDGVTALSNGNYVVASPYWSSGAVYNAGAATWANGNTGLSGPVAASNSLVGTTYDDRVGVSIAALSNGDYVVASPVWNNGTAYNAGAVTWANGAMGLSGQVSLNNSFVGTAMLDRVSFGGVTALSDGNYVVRSPSWNNGATGGVGAITLASGNSSFTGTISRFNSVRGGISGGGTDLVFTYDPTRQQLVVGRPAENIVSLFTMDQILADGFEP